MVVRVDSHAEAVDLARRLRRDRSFDLVEIEIVGPRRGSQYRSLGELVEEWAGTLGSLGRVGRDGARAVVGSIIEESEVDRARLLLHLVDLGLAERPFVLVWVDPMAAPLPRDEILRVGAATGITVQVATGRSETRRARPCRPVSPSPAASFDPDLLALAAGPDDAVAGAASRWLSDSSVKGQAGFSVIGPIVHERLERLGIETEVDGLLDGLRRRQWYRNALLRTDAVAAIDVLRSHDIEPTILGDLATSVEADRSGRVRTIGGIVLLVPHSHLERSRNVLLTMRGSSTDPVGSEVLLRRRGCEIRLGEGRMIRLTSGWLWANADARVPLTTDLVSRTAFDGIEVDGLAPTARLLELWVRAFDLRRHHRLAATVGVLELSNERGDEIDWGRVDHSCARLDLIAPPR